MPVAFWGEAVTSVVFILNRSPTKSLKGITPYEAWHGKKLDVSFLRTFGCVGHVKVTKSNLLKLEDRSVPMVFLGYEAESKAYLLFDPKVHRVVISHDVVFDEGARWNWEESGDGEGGGGGIDNSFSVKYSEYYVMPENDVRASHQDSAGESFVSETLLQEYEERLHRQHHHHHRQQHQHVLLQGRGHQHQRCRAPDRQFALSRLH
jgi:hypothetical protein